MSFEEPTWSKPTRFKGHTANPFDDRDLPIDALLQKVGAATPSASGSIRAHVGNVLDQSITSSCVAHAGTKQIFARAHFLGLPIKPIAVLPSYAIARGTLPLIDDGSVPRSFFAGTRKFGVVADARFPFDPGKVNDPVPLDVFEAGADAKVDSYHSILDIGEARCAKIRASIDAGIGVTFAMPVDDAYERINDWSIYTGRTGPTNGGHYQMIGEYGTDEGVDWFGILGSWGLSFGALGWVRMSAAYMGSVELSDFMAADIVPGSVR